MRTMIIPLALVLLAAPALAGNLVGTADCNGDCGSTVVYVEGAPTRDGAGTTVDFDQKDKVFVPHVLPVLLGATVNIMNGDPFLHNVHLYSGKETVLNIALPFQGQVIQHTFTETGTYEALCDAHPEMSAYIVVLDNPYFTTPDDNGAYEIAGLPAGDYTVVVRNVESDKIERSSVVVN